MIALLAVKSLRNRRFTVLLTIASIGMALALLLCVERVRAQVHDQFASAVTGTDLIVGARTSPVSLLLASVFHLGDATNDIRWDTYRSIAERPEVAWTIPLSLGDAHRRFRVVGTNLDYFAHYRFGDDRPLVLADGTWFGDAHGAVIGAEVARVLGYRLGQSIVMEHGSGEVAFVLHRNDPFRVVGILAATGTPVDRAIHVPLEGIEAMHSADDDPLAAALRSVDRRRPDARRITAFLVGLKTRTAALSMQRRIDQFEGEPLTAVLPGVALLEVWQIAGGAEQAMTVIAVLVVALGLAGMLVALLTSLAERRREMAVLRAIGARPWHLVGLVVGEAAFVTGAGIAVGLAMLYLALAVGRGWVEHRFGFHLPARAPSTTEFGYMLLVAVAGILVGFVPAWRIYRVSLSDGMTIRI